MIEHMPIIILSLAILWQEFKIHLLGKNHNNNADVLKRLILEIRRQDEELDYYAEQVNGNFTLIDERLKKLEDK